MRLDILVRQHPRSHQELQPARLGMVRPILGPPQKIAFGHHADQIARRIDHRQPADLLLKQQTDDMTDGRIQIDGDDRLCHHIARFHDETSLHV